jgi:DNA-binding FadR family transcriptional regulator
VPYNLRDSILSGDLAAGDKLPFESDLMRDYDISRTVPKMAINVLRFEGLITSHAGKGSFTRPPRSPPPRQRPLPAPQRRHSAVRL